MLTAERISADRSPPAGWDEYVFQHPRASVYHQGAWPRFINEVFGQDAYFIHARDEAGRLTGVLPVIRQPGPLFGSSLTSLPYFNYGGALADTEAIALALMQRAAELARDLKCRYLECRDTAQHEIGWSVRTDKVSMILDLPADADALGKALGAKMRSQIRRPDREQAIVRRGGIELVDAFYAVFARNMHALGTPVYPKRFFRELAKKFPDSVRLIVIETAGQPQAAGFLVLNAGRVEIPWAACLEGAKPRGYNMKLYWEVLSFAIEQGAKSFDFGRSTADSGTYRFKAQWGAKPLPLYWHRWEKSGVPAPQASASQGGLRELVSGLWSKLPLRVANLLGPCISPRLPW